MLKQRVFDLEPKPCAWVGSLAELRAQSPAVWLAAAETSFRELTGQRPGPQQIEAWRDSLVALAAPLAALANARPTSNSWTAIFEYALPREGGRRADLVLLAEGAVLVLEFKQQARPSAAALDQVAAYARDLAAYHAETHERPVHALLVLTRAQGLREERAGVTVCAPDQLDTVLVEVSVGPPLDAEGWLHADYAPLPSIVQAARQIFAREPLPEIRRAQSVGIPALLDYLARVVQRAETSGERHLVLITGAPGAGKTLVGLQFTYAHAGNGPRPAAVLLSGNGPLVTVLQYALRNRVFVQPVRSFFLHYGARPMLAPPERIFTFDEAQRAWDPERMSEKYGLAVPSQAALLAIAERTPGWGVVLALIGEGQEIHIGEEGGLAQWGDALAGTSQPWQLHCPPRLAGALGSGVTPAAQSALLDLSSSLRTHLAEDVQGWVHALLGGELELAATLAERMRSQQFAIHLTRELELARSYCHERYAHSSEKRYGLLASSKASNLPRHGVDNSFQTTKRLKVGPWYLDPPASPDSCCALAAVATEFACQGLELDLPVVCWGTDLWWENGAWRSAPQRRSKAREPHRLRLNSYRVLLTRGRDGLLIFVPPERRLEPTAAALLQAGATPLA